MKYRSSDISSITISSGVASASIGESNVAVSSDGASWASSIPAADLKKSAAESNEKNGENTNPSGSGNNNNSGTGW